MIRRAIDKSDHSSYNKPLSRAPTLPEHVRRRVEQLKNYRELRARQEAYCTYVHPESVNREYDPIVRYRTQQARIVLTRPKKDHADWPAGIESVLFWGIKDGKLECIIDDEGNIVLLPYNPKGKGFKSKFVK